MAVGEDAIVVDRSLFSFDTVLTGSFLVLVSAFLILFNTEEIFIMGLCCIAVLFLLKFTKATAGVCGKFVSDRTASRALDNPVTMKKWKEQSWQWVIHVGMTVWNVAIMYQVDWSWWKNTDEVWTPCGDTQVFEWYIQWFYLAQLAIWIATCFVHRFIDEIRKDYYVMFIHHVATICLVGGSYYYGYLRVGILVLLVHDGSDIVVDSLKMANYMDINIITVIVFITNLVTWAVIRLGIFPHTVMHAAAIVSFRRCHRIHGWLLMNSFLVVLLMLHVWWYFLFLRMLFRLVASGSARSSAAAEYEGDDKIRNTDNSNKKKSTKKAAKDD